MPRPTPPHRRAHILDAAREEFSARGYAATRMDDIAARIGISRSALYLQFASKEAIFRALVTGLIADTLPQVAPPDFADVSAQVLLRGLINVVFHRLTQPEMAFVPRIMVGEGQNFPELVRFYHDEGISRLFALIERIIQHGIDSGEFACPAPALACRSVAGGILFGALWKMVFEPVGGAPLDVAAMAQAHGDVLLGGLLVRQEAEQ